MREPRQPIPLKELWRIPAVIALVLLAVASRLALGAAVPLTPADGRAPLSRLEAAMVICTPGGLPKPSLPPQREPHPLSFDDQLLLDVAEMAVALPPPGHTLSGLLLRPAEAAETGHWQFITLTQRRGTRPAPRAPPAVA